MACMKPNYWIALGAILGALAVGMGALGAHALRAQLLVNEPSHEAALRLLEVYETAARWCSSGCWLPAARRSP
jgi:uncharacterized membrane protein YgdD (TMEM256/DUF423 family)